MHKKDGRSKSRAKGRDKDKRDQLIIIEYTQLKLDGKSPAEVENALAAKYDLTPRMIRGITQSIRPQRDEKLVRNGGIHIGVGKAQHVDAELVPADAQQAAANARTHKEMAEFKQILDRWRQSLEQLFLMPALKKAKQGVALTAQEQHAVIASAAAVARLVGEMHGTIKSLTLINVNAGGARHAPGECIPTSEHGRIVEETIETLRSEYMKIRRTMLDALCEDCKRKVAIYV